MDQEERLQKIKYHWHSYVARGGFSQPKRIVGRLEGGGLNHWTMFLKYAKAYLKDFPSERPVIEGFVQSGIVRMVIGD